MQTRGLGNYILTHYRHIMIRALDMNIILFYALLAYYIFKLT